MQEALPALIQALCEPRAYPHKVELVTVLQTHISWVLLAGDFAYKIKKPVKLAFLDFSSLALRQRYCQAELALNRQFAPDLYLGVVAIAQEPGGVRMNSQATALDYAVQMRRFDQSARLDRVCERGELTPGHLSGLAGSLQAYYAAAPIAPATAYWGSDSLIADQTLENFETITPLLTQAADAVRLRSLRAWVTEALARARPVMKARLREGRVRACHGDLHLANLVLLGKKVQAFDCIEFSDALRWIDVLSDLAFVYVDLLARGRDGLANWWLSEVLQACGEEAVLPLLRFYAVYRAMVRLKVACLRQSQGSPQREQIDSYLNLAERLSRPEPVELVITHGLSGSGKTVASGGWLLHSGSGQRLRLRADVQRKRLHGLAPQSSSHSEPGQGMYNAQANADTYDRLYALAQHALQAGWSVVVDASFIRLADRRSFAQLARDVGADFHILAPQSTLEEMRSRIVARQAAAQDASEATLAVLARQLQTLEPLSAQEQQFILPCAPAEENNLFLRSQTS